MFREIRSTERITDRERRENEERNRRLMEIFDKRVTDQTEEDRKFLEEVYGTNDDFDPDARVII